MDERQDAMLVGAIAGMWLAYAILLFRGRVSFSD